MVAVLVLSGVALVACTGSSGETEPDWEETHLANVAELAIRFQAEYGRPAPSDASFTRFIEPSDYGRVLAECVREQGFAADETFDGGVAYGEVPDDQRVALAEAIYRCEVAYPVHPRHLTRPANEGDLRREYDYQVNEVLPCLHAEGYDVEPPPTWEVFRDSDPSARWHPYAHVDPPSEEEWQRINQVCPQSLSMRDFFSTR
jgi:hypothetical protein